MQLTKKSQSTRETATCQTHEGKVAKFIVYSDDETLPYCEKCAILLASQGFKVTKLEMDAAEPQCDADVENPLDQLNNHPRKHEVGKFVS